MAAMSDIPDPRPSATPPATFLNFLSGLSAQVLMQFGEIPNPLTGTRTANIDYARYTVQLLEVLNEKTTGNRSRERESRDDAIRHVSGACIESYASAPATRSSNHCKSL